MKSHRSNPLLNFADRALRLAPGILCVFTVALVGGIASVQGQNATWTSTSNTTWSTGGNWNGTSTPGGNATDRATFNQANSIINPNLTVNATTGGITFTTGNFTLSSANATTALTLLGTGSTTSAAINNTAGNNIISAPIIFGNATAGQGINSTAGNLTLSGGITKSGGNLTISGAGATIVSGNMTIGGGVLLTNTGTVRLSGNNSVTGGWTLNGSGQLILDSAGALGSSGAINFNAGILVATANNTTDYSSRFTVASGGNYSLAAQSGVTLTVASALVGNGTSGLRVGAPSITGTIVLGNASNSFAGSASLNGGTLSVAGIGNAGANSYLGTNGTISIGVGSTSATLLYTGAGETTDKVINLAGGTGGATITNNGSGTLIFTSNATATGVGNKTFTLGGSGTGQFAGVIANSANSTTSLTKSDAGTWTLSGNNTYGGITTISGGTLALTGSNTFAGDMLLSANATLSIGNKDAVGQGRLRLAGGTLNVSSDLSGANALTNTSWANANVTITGANNLTISGNNIGAGASGTITNSLTGGSLLRVTGPTWAISTSTGSYTSTLAGTGNTTIDSNITSYGAGGSNGTITFSVTNNGTTTLNGNVDLTSTSGTGGLFTVNNAGGSFTQAASSVISGSTRFTLTAGNATLNGANTYTGTTTISSGTLSLTGQLGGGNYSGNITNTGLFVHAGTTTQTLSGVISGAGALTQNNSSGTLILSANNTYTGTTTITAGTLQIGAGGASGSVAGAIVNNDALVFNRNNTVSYSGNISGSGSLTKSGTGNLTLSGANTYTGVTTINTGTLTLSGASGSVAGSIDVRSGAALQLANTANTSSSNNISGSGNIVHSSAFSTTLAGANTNTGSIESTGGGILFFSGSSALSSNITSLSASAASTLSFADGTTRTITLHNSGISLSTVDLLFDVDLSSNASDRLVFGQAASLTGTNTVDLNFLNPISGGQTWTLLNAASGLNGAWRLGAYTEQTGYSFSLSSNATSLWLTAVASSNDAYWTGTGGSSWTATNFSTTLNGSATMAGDDLTGKDVRFAATGAGNLTTTLEADYTINKLSVSTPEIIIDGSNTLNVTDSSLSAIAISATGNTTINVNLAGGAGLTKSGPGTLTLNGSNSYTGDTLITGGKVVAGSNTAFGNSTSAVTVAPGTGNRITLQSGASSLALSNNFTILIGTTVWDTNSHNTTLSGAISGAGALTKNGTGTLTLAGANTYTGATTVGNGTLRFSEANGANAGAGSYTISIGATLLLDNTSANNNNRINDASAITLAGNGGILYRGSTSGNSSETVGTINVGATSSFGAPGMITLSFGGNNTATLTSSNFVRNAVGSMLVNGESLGKDTASTSSVSRFFVTTAPALVGTTNDGGTGINSSVKDAKIVAYLLGEATQSTGGLGTATGTANTFLTYNAGSGLRPLNPTDEFTNNAIVATHNTYITAATTAATTAAINSLVINGGDLSIDDGRTLTDTSGALLFVTSNAIKPSASTGALNFASGGDGIITVNPGVFGTISASITPNGSSFSITKQGGGTLTLSGNNTYTGATRLVAGTLVLNGTNSNGLGSLTTYGGELVLGSAGGLNPASSIVISSGTISTSLASVTVSNNIALNTRAAFGSATNTGNLVLTGTLNANSGNRTLSAESGVTVTIDGTISNSSSPRITFNGTGSFVLNTANAFSGGASLDSGVTVIAGNAAAFGTGTLTFNGSTGSGPILKASTDLTLTNDWKINNNWNVDTATWSPGVATITGANNVTLSGAYHGGNATQTLFSSLDAGKVLTISGPVAIASSSTNCTLIINGSGKTLISGGISNGNATTADFIKDGSGTVTLSGSNTYTGATTINSGTLALGANDVISDSSNLIINGGTFDISSFSDTVGVITMTNGNLIGTSGVLTGSAYNITGGTVSAQLGGGTLTINNGTTNIGVAGSNAALILDGSSAVANLIANVSALSVSLNNGASITGSFSLNLTSGVTANGGSIASNLIGSGGVTMNGTGNTLTLSGANTYTGATTISAGDLSISSVSALTNTSGVNLANATALIYTGGAATLDRDISVTGGTGTIRNSGTGLLALAGGLSKNGTMLTLAGGSNGITVSGVISGSAADSDLIIDGGITTLDNANTYNGPTLIINGATLNANVAGALPTSTLTAVTINGSSTLALGASQSVASLSGTTGSTVNLNANTLTINGSATTTYSGGISGTGNLVKNGSGTQTLAAANTYTGTTTVNSGTLQAAAAGAMGNSTVINVNGGSLLVTAENAVNDNAAINLGGGKLAFGDAGYNGHLGALTLSADSIIDLGTSNNGVLIRFNSINWSNANALLSIYNWTGTTYWDGGTGANKDQVYFTNTNLSSAQLQRISFYSDFGQSFVGDAFQIHGGDFAQQIIAVPETETYITGVLLLLGFGIYQLRLARQGQGLLARLTFLRQRKC